MYPYGASLSVERPARPLLSSGPVSYPLNRPIAAMWETETVMSGDSTHPITHGILNNNNTIIHPITHGNTTNNATTNIQYTIFNSPYVNVHCIFLWLLWFLLLWLWLLLRRYCCRQRQCSQQTTTRSTSRHRICRSLRGRLVGQGRELQAMRRLVLVVVGRD